MKSKYRYLQSFRLPFCKRLFWRSISRTTFAARVRPYFFNSDDDDILTFFEHDPKLVIVRDDLSRNKTRVLFRAELRG